MGDALLTQQATITLCEPYDSLREGLALVLDDHYKVTSVGRVEDLLSTLQDDPPDLLIVDVDGEPEACEVLARIRQAHRTLRVLLIAGEFSLDQQMGAIRPNSNVSFIKKPFAVDHFLEKVQTLVQGYSNSPARRHVVRIAQ